MDFDYLQYTGADYDRSSSLDALMEAYGKDVWNFALILTKKKELADDVAQEVFLKVYEKLPEFRGQSSIKTWILAITRNASMDVLRSAWIRRVVLLDLLPDLKTAPSAETDWMNQLRQEEVWSAAFSLPLKLRETLLLVCHYSMTMEETGKLLGISAGTVKSRLHRARAAMNRKLSAGQALDGEGDWV